jgi:predicted ribosomally synthesized peptide with nif11-like leader
MSLDSFNAFAAKVAADESLRDSLKAAHPEGLSLDELSTAAASHGYAFDPASVGQELADKDLDSVAGGIIIVSGIQALRTPNVAVSNLASQRFRFW